MITALVIAVHLLILLALIHFDPANLRGVQSIEGE